MSMKFFRSKQSASVSEHSDTTLTILNKKAFRLEPRILFDAAAPAVIADALHAAQGGSEAHDHGDAAGHNAGDVPVSGFEGSDAGETARVAEILGQSGGDDHVDPLLRALADKSVVAPREAEEASGDTDDASVLTTDKLDSDFVEGLSGADAKAVVVIDASVAGSEIMAQHAGDATVLMVQSGQDAFSLVADALEGRTDVSAIHIVSHGSEGMIFLGGETVDMASLEAHVSDLARWSKSLSSDGDILLYGCSVAEDGGHAFVERFAELTQADVAASVDMSGSSNHGGDWDLEYATGDIEADGTAVLNTYDGLLAAPTLTDNADGPRTVNEDEAITLTDLVIADADDDNLTVTVTTSDGTLAYNGSNNTTFTLSGDAASVTAELANVSFAGNANANGSATVSVTVNDGDTSVSQNIAIDIVPQNDAPSLTPTPLSVQENESDVAFSEGIFGLVDPDIDSGQQEKSQMIVQIVSVPTKGTLTFNGNPVVVGSSFSYDQVTNLAYFHDGSDVTANDGDSFKVQVFDGAGEDSGQKTININLLPKNSAPSISAEPSLYEGQTASVAVTISDVEMSHADALANMQVTVNNIQAQGEGTLFLDEDGDGKLSAGDTVLANGNTFSGDQLDKLMFAHNGTEPGATKPSFNITVTDAGGGEGAGHELSASETITINTIKVDDDPTLTKNPDGGTTEHDGYGTAGYVSGASVSDDYFDLGTGLIKSITNGDLAVNDVDTDTDRLVYELHSLPANGKIQVNIAADGDPADWRNLVINGRFTQDQIDDGKVRFYRTSDAAGTDTFSFVVRDSELKAWQADDDPTGKPGGIYEDGTNTLKEFTFHVDMIATTGSDDGSQFTGFPSLQLIGTGDGNSITMYEGKNNTITTALLNFASADAGAGYSVPTEEITYRLTSLAGNGDLQRFDGTNWVTLTQDESFTQADIDADHIQFQHDGGETMKGALQFSVTDGILTRGITFNVDATPINDVPVAVGGEQMVEEGGTFRITDELLAISDQDGSDKPSEVEGGADSLWFAIGQLPEDGTLQYWDGSAWVDLVAGNLAADGASALWFSKAFLTETVDGAKGGLRYTHGGDDAPVNLTDNFSVVVRDDLTAPGAGETVRTNQSTPTNAALTTTNGAPAGTDPASHTSGNDTVATTVNIEVAPMNDAPEVAPDYNNANSGAGLINNLLTIAEGQEDVVIDNTYLQAIDSDNTTTQRQFRIVAGGSVQNGTLKLNGTVLGVGSTFTQADIDNNLLTYTHNGKEVYADHFDFIVSDGLEESSGRFDISVTTTLNDIPDVTVPTNPVIHASTGEVAVGPITLTDADLVSIDAGETDFITVKVESDSPNTVMAVTSSGAAAVANNGVRNTDLVISGTLADVQATLNTLKVSFRDASNNPVDEDNTVTFAVTVDDRLVDGGGNPTNTANGGATNDDGTAVSAANNTVVKTFAVQASSVNDAPTADAVAPSNITVDEDTEITIGHFGFNDVDTFDSTNNTVTVAVGHGTLNVTGAGGVNVSGNGGKTLTLTGTLAQINDTLDSLKYKGDTDFNGADTITLTYDDQGNYGEATGAGTTATVTQNITVQPVNDAPTITGPTGVQHLNGADYTFNGGNEFVIDDAKDIGQGIYTDSFTVTVTATADGTGYGTLTLPGGSTLVDSNGANDVLTITGTKAEINAALNGLVFTPDATNGDKVVTITAEVNDNANGGAGGAKTATHTVDIAVSDTNDAPTIDTTVADPANHFSATEDAWADLDVKFLDTDTFGSTNNTVTVTVGHGVVKVTDNAQIQVTGNESNNLTITGSLDDINAALDSLQYKGEAHFNGADTIDLTYNDAGNYGTGGAQEVTFNGIIDVSAVNDAPTGSGATTLAAVNEDTTDPAGESVNGLFSSFFHDDLDNKTAFTNGSSANTFAGVVVVGNAATATQGEWQYKPDGGNWTTLDTTVSAASGLTLDKDAMVRFVPAGDYNGTPGQLTVRLAESGGAAVTTGATVDVSGGNSGGTTIYSDVNNQVTLTTSITPVNDAPTGSSSVTLAAVNEDTGDPAGESVQNLFTTPFNDSTDAVTGGSPANDLAGVVVVGNAATAAQGEWQYKQADGTWVTINTTVSATTGLTLAKETLVRFVPADDYNGTPGQLTVRLADDSGGGVTTGDVVDFNTTSSGGTTIYSDSSNEVTLTTSVTAVNDAPVNTVPGAQSMQEDRSIFFSGSNEISIADVDSTNMEVTVSVGHGTLDMTDGSGATITNDGSGTVTLTGSTAQINNALNGMTYTPTGDWNGTDTLTITTDDQSGTATSETVDTVDITVNPVNDAPTGSGSATLAAVNEDTANPSGESVQNLFTTPFNDSKDTVEGGSSANNLAGVVVVGNAATAAEGAWEYSTDGGTNWVTIDTNVSATTGLTLAKDAMVRFVPAGDYNGTPGQLTVRLAESGGAAVTTGDTVDVSGGNSGGTTIYSDAGNQVTLSTSVTAVNDAPVNTVPGGQTVAEDGVLTFSGANTISIADVDSTNMQVTVSVDHGTLDVINGTGATITNDTTGTVTLTGTKAQIDAALDGMTYTPAGDWNGTDTLTITTDDQSGTPTSQDVDTVAITVTSVNDAPTGSGSVALPPVNENAANPGGETVDFLFNSAFGDSTDAVTGGSPANDLAGVVVVGNAATAAEGEWQYKQNDGTWATIPAVADMSNAGITLAKDTLVRFVPATDYNGTPGQLTVRLVDDSSGAVTTGTAVDFSSTPSGGTTIYSDAGNQVTLTTAVTDVNHAPLVTKDASGNDVVATLLAVDEDTADPAGKSVQELFTPTFDDSDDAVVGGSVADLLAGVVVVGNDATAAEGEWQYKQSDGTWATIGTDVSDTAGLTLAKDTLVRFVPVGDYNGTPGELTVRLAESGGAAVTTGTVVDFSTTPSGGSTIYSDASNEATLTTSVTAVNDAPTGSTSVVLPAVDEDADPAGESVQNLFTPAFDDSTDAVTGGSSANDLAGVVVVGNAADATTEGQWQYKQSDGTWATIDTTVSDTSGLTLAKDTLVRFVPVANYNGTPGELTARLVESGGAAVTTGTTVDFTTTPSGGTTIYSDANNEVTLTTSVTAVNDAPVNTVPGGQTVAEDGSLVFSGTNLISIADIDSDNMQVTVSVGHGTLDMTDGTGATITNDGSGSVTLTGTKAQINAALDGMTYTPTEDWNGTDTLTITTDDQSGTATNQDVDTVAITVTPVNDAPIANADSGSVELYGETTVTGNVLSNDTDLENGALRLAQVNGSAGNVGTVIDGTYGTVTINADGSYTYELDTTNPVVQALAVGDTVQDTIPYQAQDAEGMSSNEATLVITVGNKGAPATPGTDGDRANSDNTGNVDGPVNVNPIAPLPPSGGRDVVQDTGGSGVSGDNSSMDSGSTLDSTRDVQFSRWMNHRFTFELSDQTFQTNKTSEFRIPAAAIHHTDPAAQISFEATLPDGSPLPNWVTFDPSNQTFAVTPPTDAPERITIVVHAYDEQNREAKATFTLKVINNDLEGAAMDDGTSDSEDSQNVKGDNNQQEQEQVPQNLTPGQQVPAGEDTAAFTGKPAFSSQLLAGVQDDASFNASQLAEALQRLSS